MKPPVVPTLGQIEQDAYTIPRIEGGVPDGWEEADQTWFVDHSGFGQEGEPALTYRQFKNALYHYAEEHPTHGYGIVSVGQFQLFVAAFKPVEADEPIIVRV